jgi:hypothetical protein
MTTIDKDKLRELALDPRNGVKEICAGLGMADPTFYQHLDRDPELKKTYQEARDQMRANRDTAKGSKPRAIKASTRQTGKPFNPPPQWECQGRHRSRAA